ncbi:MAG: DNA polymerase III subunit delta [Alphaproteobacteria bacterium]|nr:DNA polymerase III subunit delta [Alphaproteobacteria bacterium]
MKLSASRTDAFLRSPDPAVRAVLIYGPDTGLVRERAETIAKTVVADLTDPFLVADLAGDGLADDPARLADEAAAMALTGGRRLVRVRDATDRALKAVEAMAVAPTGDSLVVMQAGELTPRSAMRRFFESAKDMAALPCYADDSRGLEQLAHEVFAASNVTAAPQAIDYLVANLGADRGLSRSELEKLALYAGEGGTISVEDAMAVVGDSAALSLDDVVYAATDGEAGALDRAYAKSMQEGVSPVAVLRAISGHLLRLQAVAARVAAGEPPAQAVKALRPPVFFKRTAQFVRQARIWQGRRVARALDLTMTAERGCKTTGMPDAALCGRALMQIAALARQGRRPG